MRVVLIAAVATSWLVATLVSGESAPRRRPLPNAERMDQIIRFGLFPDKPRDMSFIEYFGNFTDLDENLTKALERLEYGVLDAENLEIAIKLAEDARRFKELTAPHPQSARRQEYPREEIFNMKNMPSAWNSERKEKIFQFMQHSLYSTRYEINRLHHLRKKYNESEVFKIGILYGNSLEIKNIAGVIFTTLQRMPNTVSMLWFLFHYHKLLNLAYDVTSNVEHAYALNKRLTDGFLHYTAMKANNGKFSMPMDSAEVTSMVPDES